MICRPKDYGVTFISFSYSGTDFVNWGINFKMESCDEPLEKYALSGPLLMPRKAAACRVICSAAGGPHRHSFLPKESVQSSL